MSQSWQSVVLALMFWVVFVSDPAVTTAQLDEFGSQLGKAEIAEDGTADFAEREFIEEKAQRRLHELAEIKNQSALHGRTIEILVELAELRHAQGRITEADGYFDEALAAQALSRDDLRVAELALQIGSFYLKCGRYARAEPVLRRALDTRTRAKRTDLLIAECYSALARMQRRQGRFHQAVVSIGHVLNLQDAAELPQTDPLRAAALLELAEAHLGLKDYDSASALYQTAGGLLRKRYGKGHITAVECLSALGDVCSLRGDPHGAKHFYRQTLGALEKHYGTDHLRLGVKLIHLARSQFQLNENFADILANLNRAESILKLHKAGPYEAFPLYQLRAKVNRAAGKKQTALDDLLHAMKLAELLRSGSSGDAMQRARYLARSLLSLKRR